MKTAMILALAVLMQGEPTLTFETPKEWVKETPASNMRKAQYKVSDKEKKAGDAELLLFYFGAGGAGGVDANLKRWAGQMGQTEYKSEAIEGKCKVTLVDLTGTYSDRGTSIENARMIAAVVATDQGPFFFKLVGPAETVGDWREETVQMLKEARLP